MDLRSPLRSLVPSLDSAVLEVLAGTESALSVTQIGRLARRGSRAGHTRVLERLVDHGLVLAQPANTGSLYRLNHEHLLTQAVCQALGVRHELINRLGDAVSVLTPTPVHASLFGSFARREGTDSSDIDLLIVTPAGHDSHAAHWRGQLQDLEDRVRAWTGNRLEPLVLSEDKFREIVRAGEPLIDSLRSDAITVCGASLDSMLTTQRSAKTAKTTRVAHR